MEAVINAILLKPSVSAKQVSLQLSIFEVEEIEAEKKWVSEAFDKAMEWEKVSRSIFAQNAIKVNEMETDLKELDEAIGDVKVVEQFIIESLRFMGVQVEEKKEGYKIYATNIPQRLRDLLTDKNEIQVSFKSRTPTGYKYIGRNHPFAEHLSQHIINNALQNSAARAAVLRSADVK